MATHDYIISNASGAAVRADLNNALAAIASNNSSATEPTTTYAYQWWADTGSSPTVMKLRNAANSGWVTLFQLDGEWSLIPFENGTAAAPSIYFKDSGTDTGFYSPGVDQVGITTGGVARLTTSTTAVTSTLPVVYPLGAVGTPSVTFTGDLNTGIYSPGADSVAITTGGTQRATVDSSGRLLVGTSTSVSQSGVVGLLQVEATSVNEAAIKVRNNQNTNSGPFVALTKSRGTTIGSNTIVQNGDDLGTIIWYGADGTDADSYAAQITCQVDGTPGANDMPGRLVFSTTPDGTSNPTERMRLDNKGSLSLWFPTNTTASPQDLDARAFFYSDGTSSGLYIDSRNSSSFVHINQSYADTANRGAIAFYRNESSKGSISVDSSQVYYNTTSDYRLKENITALTDAVQKLTLLKPSRFNFIEAPDRTVDGFIAHEVQEIIPEAVTGAKDAVDDDGNPIYQGIDQSKLVPLLTAALQEAIAKIETLEVKVAALEAN